MDFGRLLTLIIERDYFLNFVTASDETNSYIQLPVSLA